MLPPLLVPRSIFTTETLITLINRNPTDFYTLQKTPFDDKDKTQI